MADRREDSHAAPLARAPLRGGIGAALAVAWLVCAAGPANAAEPEGVRAGSAPAGWPPSVESLVVDESCARALPCDPDAPLPDVASVRRWDRILRTEKSDCTSPVRAFDPRAREGNVLRERVPLRFRGNCVVDGRGKVIGALHGGVLARCTETSQPWGVTALEAAVVDLSAQRGRAHIPLVGLPWLLTGQRGCRVDMAIEMRIAEETPTVGAESGSLR